MTSRKNKKKRANTGYRLKFYTIFQEINQDQKIWQITTNNKKQHVKYEAMKKFNNI